MYLEDKQPRTPSKLQHMTHTQSDEGLRRDSVLVYHRAVCAAQVTDVEAPLFSDTALLSGLSAVLDHRVVPGDGRVLQGHAAHRQPSNHNVASVSKRHRVHNCTVFEDFEGVRGVWRRATPGRLCVRERGELSNVDRRNLRFDFASPVFFAILVLAVSFVHSFAIINNLTSSVCDVALVIFAFWFG